MTDEQIQRAARQCRDEALCDALRLAADGDIDVVQGEVGELGIGTGGVEGGIAAVDAGGAGAHVDREAGRVGLLGAQAGGAEIAVATEGSGGVGEGHQQRVIERGDRRIVLHRQVRRGRTSPTWTMPRLMAGVVSCATAGV